MENTASDRMAERQAACSLPDANVQRFLLDVLDQQAFPGKLAAYVVQVLEMLRSADLPK